MVLFCALTQLTLIVGIDVSKYSGGDQQLDVPIPKSSKEHTDMCSTLPQ